MMNLTSHSSRLICPLVPGTVDAQGARVVAALTVAALGLWSATQQSLLVALFLSVDFALRSGKGRDYSPLRTLARHGLNAFAVAPNPVNLGPKQFAARIGLLFSLTLVTTSFLALPILGWVIAAIFVLCATLEAVFGFCMGCVLYTGLVRLGILRP